MNYIHISLFVQFCFGLTQKVFLGPLWLFRAKDRFNVSKQPWTIPVNAPRKSTNGWNNIQWNKTDPIFYLTCHFFTWLVYSKNLHIDLYLHTNIYMAFIATFIVARYNMGSTKFDVRDIELLRLPKKPDSELARAHRIDGDISDNHLFITVYSLWR